MPEASTSRETPSRDDSRVCRAKRLGTNHLAFVAVIAVAASLLGLNGPRLAMSQSSSVAVRLVHVSPDTVPIDATLNDQPLANDLAYGAASSRLPWSSGMARLRVRASGDPSRTLLDTSVELSIDSPSTILLAGLARGSPALAALVLADDLGNTPQDRSRVRFVNVAARIGAVTLISGGAALFEDIGDGAMGDAVLDPGPLSLRVLPSRRDGPSIAETQLTAEPGRSYTVVLAGRAGSDPTPSLFVFDHSRAAPPGSASRGPVEPGTVLVDETFADPTTGLLPATAPANATLIFGYAAGEYSLRNLEVATQSLPVPVDATNATIAVDTRLIGDTTRRTVSVGCRFGSDSTGNRGYRLRVEPGAGLFRVVREDGTRDIFLRRDSVSPAIRRDNERNRLEITCAGSTITASINGTVVATVQDSTYTSGSLVIGVGARASGLTSEARFDNLVVTAR